VLVAVSGILGHSGRRTWLPSCGEQGSLEHEAAWCGPGPGRRALGSQRPARSLGRIGRAADGPDSAQERSVKPLLEARLRRLDLGQVEGAVGVGYDLVDARVLTASGEPAQVTLMLDSGLTTNLVTPELRERLGLLVGASDVQGTALGGVNQKMQATLLPGLELLGDASGSETRFEGVWEGAGWRARCVLDWDSWVASAKKSGGRVVNGEVEYTVLPTAEMTDEQVTGLVGRRGTEFVEGELLEGGTYFKGRGASVEPKGLLALTEKYEFRLEGDELVDLVTGSRLQRATFRPSLALRPPLLATSIDFLQEDIARKQGVKLEGMLGQLPLYRDTAVELFAPDHQSATRQMRLLPTFGASAAAEAAGMVEVPASDLPSGLIGVRLAHSPLLRHPGEQTQSLGESVISIVDTGSANTILNWPAAELLLGLKRNDRVVEEAPILRAVGVGGGKVDMPLLTLSVALVAEGADGGAASVQPRPVRVAIGDAEIFADIMGREEKGSWPFGMGPKAQRPAALIGQDVWSQHHYILAAGEPSMFVKALPDWPPRDQRLDFIGVGDCLDQSGRRLQGLQKLSVTLDEAADICYSLPRGACKGVAVTPQGRFQGLAYIFLENGQDDLEERLNGRGWRRYLAPEGQDLAPAGAEVVTTTGKREADDALCFAWRSA